MKYSNEGMEREDTLSEEILNKTIYRLCGYDVLVVLENNDLLGEMTDTEVTECIEWLSRKFEMEWCDSLSCAVDCYLEMKECLEVGNQ